MVSTLLTPGECDKIIVAVHVITIVIVSCILRTAGLLILLTEKANRPNAQSNVVQGQNVKHAEHTILLPPKRGVSTIFTVVLSAGVSITEKV